MALQFSFLTQPLTPPALVVGFGLLAGAGALDYAALKALVYLPLYYSVLIVLGAWRYGARMGLLLTLVGAALNLGLAWWLVPEWANTLGIHVQRVVWFGLFYGVAWLLSLAHLAMEFYRRSSEWRGQLKPLRVGEHLVLAPAQKAGAALDARDRRLGDIPIFINPGTAFGTGSHPTTQMCLALLEKYIQPGDRVFDLGSGSGILAIAAIKLGAAHAVAADIDPEAQRVIGANLAVNDLSPTEVTYRPGSLEVARTNAAPAAPVYEQFNVTIANILAHVILDALRAGLGETLTPEGLLIISGIKTEQRAELQDALAAANLTVVEERTALTDQTAETWLAVAVRRNESAS